MFSAPAGIALTSPKTAYVNSGENITLAANKQTDISVGQKIILAAGKAISLFAQTAGIKAFTAKDELLLTYGGAYIRLKGGQIEYGSPGNQTVNHQLGSSRTGVDGCHPSTISTVTA